MKKVFLLVAGCFLLVVVSYSQTVSQRLNKAFAAFEKDEQLKHAISSFYVIDAKTGQVVFDKNSQIGLAPASTQKIITSVTAFELLGKDYRYKTQFLLANIKKEASLLIVPSGDPTLGSWRWNSTRDSNVLANVGMLIKSFGSILNGAVMVDIRKWSSQSTPDGWIWQDIGNYYGAGSGFLNWRENQYEVLLKSGSKIGDRVDVIKTIPTLYLPDFKSEVIAAAKGSGDNAYIYLPVNGANSQVEIRGTIPVNEQSFSISGSMINPPDQFIETVVESNKNNFRQPRYLGSIFLNDSINKQVEREYVHFSPSLDSIIYWFNKKSINLYGEALIKTFAYEKQGFGRTDSGVAIVKKFWKETGLDEDELNIYDGSGLSPLNRVTTHAQVEVLKYAKTKDWFPYFLKSLPEYNGMTMKSGTISDVKGFCGYNKAKDGKEYIFSFLVNNYSGKSSQLVGKMYKVLDELK